MADESYWIERAQRMGPDVERLAEAIFGADDVLLHLRRVHLVVAFLTAFYVAAAIVPWTFLLLTL